MDVEKDDGPHGDPGKEYSNEGATISQQDPETHVNENGTSRYKHDEIECGHQLIVEMLNHPDERPNNVQIPGSSVAPLVDLEPMTQHFLQDIHQHNNSGGSTMSIVE